jgi:hypothetical protein
MSGKKQAAKETNLLFECHVIWRSGARVLRREVHVEQDVSEARIGT